MKMRYRSTSMVILLLFTLVLTSFLYSGNVEASGDPTVSKVKNLIRLPLTRQDTDYTCGVTALQSILGYYGIDKRLDELSAAAKANPEEGTSYKNIANYATSQGFDVNIRTNMTLDELKGYIDKRKPVLVLIQAWTESHYAADRDEDGHYVVAIGYDKNNVYFMDPSTLGHYTYIPTTEFVSRWHDRDTKDSEVLVRFGMIMTKTVTTPYNSDKITRLD